MPGVTKCESAEVREFGYPVRADIWTVCICVQKSALDAATRVRIAAHLASTHWHCKAVVFSLLWLYRLF